MLQKRDLPFSNCSRKFLVMNCKNWQHGCLKQFKPYFNQLRLGLDILFYDEGQQSIPVVSFRFLTDSVESFYVGTAYISMEKLMRLVGGYMWYPAL